MKRMLIAAVAALFFFVSASAQNLPFESVVPIQEIKLDPHDDGKPFLVNVCGAVSINQAKRYWLTAQHCLEDTDASYIKGDLAKTVMKDVKNDLAIIQTPTITAPSVKMAEAPLQLGELAYTIGYPQRLTVPLYLAGTVANPLFEYNEMAFVVIQFPVAPGSSGSPVFNSKNELVSVVQRGFTQGAYSPIGSVVHFEKIKALALWWEK